MAQRIKLGSDTYLDASGVVVDSTGQSLSDWMDNTNENLSTTPTLVNCTGNVSLAWRTFRKNSANTRFAVLIRGRITNFVRTGSGPSLQWQTSARPASEVYSYGGFHTEGGTVTTLGPEVCIITLSTSGLLTLQFSETYANVSNGTIYFMMPQTIFGLNV